VELDLEFYEVWSEMEVNEPDSCRGNWCLVLEVREW
jgi:hypothetical protein